MIVKDKKETGKGRKEKVPPGNQPNDWSAHT